MTGPNRAPLTLLGLAGAGALLWVAAQLGRHSTGGYWAAYGIVAAGGLVLGFTQIRGRSGHPPTLFLFGFLPALIVGGWILLAMQPHGNWFRGHVLTWSGDIGVRDVVRDLATWLGVIAFGIGYAFATVLEPAPLRRPVETETYDRSAADLPTRAERREVDSTPAPVTTVPAGSQTTTVSRTMD